MDEALDHEEDDPTIEDCLLLALIEQKQGHVAEARKWLDQASHAMDQQAKAGEYLPWRQRAEQQLLRREAEAMLKEPPTEPKK
jgi:hypothetical protein